MFKVRLGVTWITGNSQEFFLNFDEAITVVRILFINMMSFNITASK